MDHGGASLGHSAFREPGVGCWRNEAKSADLSLRAIRGPPCLVLCTDDRFRFTRRVSYSTSLCSILLHVRTCRPSNMPRSFPTLTTDRVREGIAHLRTADRRMANVIERVGPFTLKPERDRFGMLVRSIISQQISTAAARSIRQRLVERLAPERVSAAAIAALSTEELRAVGLSPQKTAYLQDLSDKVSSGTIRLDRISRLDDEQVIQTLLPVKGVGRWTAQMFLLFSLGRIDVLAPDDLGIRAAMKRIYELPELPDRKTCEQIAEPWRPYASIASWYCWRSGDLERAAADGRPPSSNS